MSWSIFLLSVAIIFFLIAFVIPFGIIVAYSGISRNKAKINKDMLEFQIQKKREELEIDKKQNKDSNFGNINGGTSKKQ